MKLKFIIIILITGLFASCVRDLEVSEPEYSDVAWVTSEFRNQDFTVGINDFITFTDLSVNAVDHAWTITEGSAFLESPLTRNDTILENFIIPNAGLVSQDKTVNVLFTQSGLRTVNFRNTFRDSVSYRTSQGNIAAVREGNLFVMDTTFVVDVYDTIVPVIDIRRPDSGESVAFQSESDVIVIEAGDFLEFVDLSVKDRVTTRAWRIEENGSVGDSIGLFQFKKLGEFKGVADLTRSGENIPFDFERLEIPATFQVVPSSKPFEVSGDIVELEDETIQIPFNGEFAPFGAHEQFFTVNVNGVEFTIESLSINSLDATILEIKLTEPIYRPDVITVSYDGNGTFLSTDTRSPVAFTDLPVIMHDVSVVPAESAAIYDFEGFDAEVAWTLRGDNADSSIEISDERASSGNTSLKIVTQDGGTARFQCNEALDFPAGTYIISYDLFIEEGSTFGETWPSLQNPFYQQWRPTGQNDVPRGQWVKISTTKDVVFGSATSGTIPFIRLQAGSGTAYIDNWRIVPKEERP